jgi:RNA polymerase sigma-70 factor (TIGR02960 family)
VGTDDLSLARSGDREAFAALVAPSERNLFLHCYRMLGSGTDAEDAVQEALLRAWRRLDTYDGSGAFAGWLYRIATNVCLDDLRSSRVHPVELGPASDPGGAIGGPDLEVLWVEPVRVGPEEVTVRAEDVSLAFVTALQRLPARQRACLLLHDVLGFSQAEVAESLEMTPSSVNSLLHRARLAARPPDEVPPPADDQLSELLARYIDAWRRADIEAFVSLVADDIRLSMPPMRAWFSGRDAVAAFVEHAIFAAARPYGVTLVAGTCNLQPALASYQPDASGAMALSGVQVLEVRGLVTDITSYRDPEVAARCGFPAVLS